MSPTMEFDAAEANRLYWETDRSVAEIAQQLDISRRALYGAVEPFPAGEPCPDCGGELTFENRSARRAGLASCVSCAADASQEDDVGTQSNRGQGVVESEPANAGEERLRAFGAGLAGVALGALVTLTLVPRR